MLTGVFWQAVYWLSMPALAVLSLLLIYRKLVREFPFFWSYITASLLVGVVRLLTYRGPANVYTQVYWISDAVDVVFALLATSELILTRLFPKFHKTRLLLYLFAVASVVIAASVIFTVFTNHPAFQQRPPILPRTLHTIDVIRVVGLLLFVSLMLFMGRAWGRYEFGIGLGLGILAAVSLISFAFFTKSSRNRNQLGEALPLTYDLACAIWLITFSRAPKQIDLLAGPTNSEILQQAREWEDSLKESVISKKRL